MKTIKSIVTLFVLSIAFSTVSCDNEPVDPALDLSAGGSVSSVFTAKIDGNDFTASTTVGDFTSTTLGNQLIISGLTSNGKSISIQIINPAVGTFAASTSSSDLCLLQYFDTALGATNGAFSSYNPISNTSVGTVTITEFDRTNDLVSGTFSFSAYNVSNSTTKSITNGVFTDIEFDNQVD
ncbi:DUF6252 family protein [Flavobacterium channae]|uniref:DUF6252 family protein n=1 Tax=Flavobacterium channae TaxID=2897181 RepID=UPI001E436F89|nr:DUF6252 family protein [Flavobacterium channae]UGS22743.1 DUF6252 family protein [Flavobacterium channae]